VSWIEVDTSGLSLLDTYGIAWDNNKFVVVCYGGIMTSPDGASWTEVEVIPFKGSHINAIAYASGRWVAVGDDGKMAYSDD